MNNLIATTPDTIEYEKQIADLLVIIEEQQKVIERQNVQTLELRRQIDWFIAVIKKNNKRTFGQSSEKTEYVAGVEAISLFNEVEKESDPNRPEPEIEEVVIPEHTVKRPKKQIGHRDEILEGLEVFTIEHIIDDPECPKHGEMHVIGKEFVRREVEIKPAQVWVTEHWRLAYGCRPCEIEGECASVVKAEMPPALIPKSLASSSAVAYIMYEKYVNGVPLNRQENDLKLHGLVLPRQTMANWVIICATKYLAPVYEQMHKVLISLGFMQADETTVQVLKEEGRKPTTDSYMWLYRSAERVDPQIVLFEYQPTRSAKHP